jgi:antitoxin (DNA-binding transcriptional repressor) of toxin-antitoxin stability system
VSCTFDQRATRGAGARRGTRRGLPVAKLVPATPGFDRDKARSTARALREASRGTTLEGISIKDLVEDGRR